MKFGPQQTDDALGCILAHTLVLSDGRLKKGRMLDHADIERIKGDGVHSVIVAKLEEGDVDENEAAWRVASGLKTHNVQPDKPFTGRANLYSTCAGVFFASKEGVDNINRIAPAITLATLPNGAFVGAGRMVATVKIIPFSVEERALKLTEEICFHSGILTVRETVPMEVGLIATELPALKPATMDKTARILKERLAETGSRLIEELRVEHSAKAVATALKKMDRRCDLIILFGASAIADRADVIPSGLEQAGGSVSTFGMPVDPGNLLLTGAFDGKPVIGAPGCARSPVLNGFDWVLHRMLAGMSVDEDYLSGLGVGGLLMEINSRPQLREVKSTDG